MKMKINFSALLMFIVISTISSLYAQVDAQSYFTYLQELYKRNDKQVTNFIITEMNCFLRMYPEDTNAARVLAMQDTLFERNGKKNESFACTLKMLFLYPQSPLCANCNANLQKLYLTDKNILEKKELITNSLLTGPTDVLRQNRYYNYLHLLHGLKMEKLYEWTQTEIQNFVQLFPADTRLDQILAWSAELYGLSGNKNEAVDTYLKITIFYPKSLLLPQVMYERGLLYNDKLNNPEAAVAAMTALVEKYPQSDYAANALLQSATLKKDKLKDYNGAIADYRQFINLYPAHDKVMEALWNIAQIYHKNLKDYNLAISAYNEVVTKYNTFVTGVNALEEIADIYEKTLRDIPNAVKALVQISELHPTFEKSPDYLFEAASLCEKELKDLPRAKEYYELFLKKYPNHKKAKDATRQIEKIQPSASQTTSPLEY
ncbi:MAG TPA: tetratricopeptide repeat protein [bacterium]|nr:tetratricopeptide repeat protein [bacterium]HPN43135.1 tetratricopeptide repeat protein [bacterium]